MKTAPQTSTSYPKIPKTYAGLMALHLLRPLRDQVDAVNAAEMIDLLAGHTLNAEQADYLDLLSDLYEKWESKEAWDNYIQFREQSGAMDFVKSMLADAPVFTPCVVIG